MNKKKSKDLAWSEQGVSERPIQSSKPTKTSLAMKIYKT